MGEPKESPSLRGESKNLSNFRGGILLFWVENWPKIFQRGGGNILPKSTPPEGGISIETFSGGISFRLLARICFREHSTAKWASQFMETKFLCHKKSQNAPVCPIS